VIDKWGKDGIVRYDFAHLCGGYLYATPAELVRMESALGEFKRLSLRELAILKAIRWGLNHPLEWIAGQRPMRLRKRKIKDVDGAWA
jgi:hypothetical protein